MQFTNTLMFMALQTSQSGPLQPRPVNIVVRAHWCVQSLDKPRKVAPDQASSPTLLSHDDHVFVSLFAARFRQEHVGNHSWGQQPQKLHLPVLRRDCPSRFTLQVRLGLPNHIRVMQCFINTGRARGLCGTTEYNSVGRPLTGGSCNNGVTQCHFGLGQL